VRLLISDDGAGFDPTAGEGRRGMGSRLIGSFATQLGGTFGYAQEGGTRFQLSFPNSKMPTRQIPEGWEPSRITQPNAPILMVG
jgi:two-component sensor histidine kinase